MGSRERLGVFGGTFDPVHVGHLVAAVEARYQLDLDRVLFVVAGDPWQKRGQVVAPADARFAMVAGAIADVDGFEASTIELDRSGPTYTIDTVADLAAAHRDLFLIVGSPNSSNSKRLVEVALKSGARQAALVKRASEIDWEAFGHLETVGLSAGASAPEVIDNEIIDAFRARYDATVELAEMAEENEHFPVNRELRKIELTHEDMAWVNG